MYKINYTLLENKEEMSYSGDKTRVDFYSGITQNLHTISINVRNFKGRIYIEATLEPEPAESDWFPVKIVSEDLYREYPLDSQNPTGDNGGDTITEGFTFKGNFLYIRARVDREYLKSTPSTEYDETVFGTLEKILMNI